MPKSEEAMRKLRSERFARAQAALPEAQRLNNRTDLALRSEKAFAFGTRYRYGAACKWFQQFMEDCHPELYDPKYFETEGGPIYTTETFKAYAVYLSQTKGGRINDKPKVNTIIATLRTLFLLIERRRYCSIPKVHKEDVENFVTDALKDQEGLTTASLAKPLALVEDTSHILSVLYSPAYLATFADMRIVFNMTLFINLMIDAAGRGGDMLFNRASKEIPLAWKHVDIYAFPAGNDGVHFEAVITFQFLKGMKLDESRYKRVPVSLLSTRSAVEDSMRLLLMLALMDGILDDGLNSWEDLMRLRPPPQGAQLRIKPSMAELPVFRKVGVNNVLSDLPELQQRVQWEIRRLRFACGFEHRLTGYAWRRGAAYILDANATIECRKYLMGHHSNSKTFSSYQSKVADVDLQGLYRGAEKRDLTRVMGISLNRKDDAPTRVSEAGYAEVLSDPALTALHTAFLAIEAALKSEHGSAAAASRAHDPRFEEYRTLSNERRTLKASLMQRKFKEEYAAFFAQSACPMSPAGDHIAQQPSLPIRAAGGGGGQKYFSTTTCSGGSSSTAPTKDIPLDPQLFADDSAPTIYEDLLFLSELDPLESKADTLELSDETALPPVECDTQALLEGEAEDEAESGENVADLPDQTAAMPTSRLHGLPNKPLTRAQKGSSRYYVGSNRCAGFYEALTEGSNEAKLMQRAIECFSITHPIDNFFPGQEPLPGTYSCPICHLDLLRESGKYDPKLGRSAWRHCFNCSQKVLLERAEEEIRTRCPFNRPCRFQKLVVAGSATTLEACGHIATSWSNFRHHLTFHFRSVLQTHVTNGSPHQVWYCFFDGCAHDLSPRGGTGASDSTYRNDPRFGSAEELYSHVAAAHDTIYKQNQKHNVEFCHYCETWLGPFDDFVAHTMTHEGAAAQLVKDSGYEAPTFGRLLRPDLCIFCYHDHARPLHERIVSKASATRAAHLCRHLSKISDTSSTRCPAYPEMCTCDTSFTKEEFLSHLNKTHGITVPAKLEKRKRADSGVEVLQEKSTNTTVKSENVTEFGKERFAPALCKSQETSVEIEEHILSTVA